MVETQTGDPMSGLWVIMVAAVLGGALAWPLKRAVRREDATTGSEVTESATAPSDNR